MSIISNHCFQANLQAFVCFHEEIEDIIAIFWTWISKILRIFTAECKAVRYCSCPLSRNRDRIILHRRSMPKQGVYSLAEVGTNIWKNPVPTLPSYLKSIKIFNKESIPKPQKPHSINRRMNQVSQIQLEYESRSLTRHFESLTKLGTFFITFWMMEQLAILRVIFHVNYPKSLFSS